MNTFTCKHMKESLSGQSDIHADHGTHYECLIQSRSSILLVFGKTLRGYFACMSDFEVGCHLANLNDVFWNTERLTAVLGIVDGVTVAAALLHLFKELGYPEF